MPEYLKFRSSQSTENQPARLQDPSFLGGTDKLLPSQQETHNSNELYQSAMAQKDDEWTLPATPYSPASFLHGYRENRSTEMAKPSQPWSYKMPTAPLVINKTFPYGSPVGRVCSLTCVRSPRIAELQACIGPNITPSNLPYFNWEYEDRRKASEILPFLYVGPLAAAKNRERCKSLGITMLIAIRESSGFYSQVLDPKRFLKEEDSSKIACATLTMGQSDGHIQTLWEGIEVINQHLCQLRAFDPSNPGKVLIFCENGNNRSAFLATAYIMYMYGVNVADAMGYVQHRRFSTSLESNLDRDLDALNNILQAKFDVENTEKWEPMPFEDLVKKEVGNSAEAVITALPVRDRADNHKRNISSVDRDVEMGNADSERFTGRQVVAPFASP